MSKVCFRKDNIQCCSSLDDTSFYTLSILIVEEYGVPNMTIILDYNAIHVKNVIWGLNYLSENVQFMREVELALIEFYARTDIYCPHNAEALIEIEAKQIVERIIQEYNAGH